MGKLRSPGVLELFLVGLALLGCSCRHELQGLFPGGGGCALLEGGDIRDRVNPPALPQMSHEAAFALTLSAFVTFR